MSGILRSPLLPLPIAIAAGAATCVLSVSMVKVCTASALFLLYCAYAAWSWWGNLTISVDGVSYKDRRSTPKRRRTVLMLPTRPPPLSQEPPATAPVHTAASANVNEGFTTPRASGGVPLSPKALASQAAPTASGSSFTEWAPFSPSFPYGDPLPAAVTEAIANGQDPPPYWLTCDASVFDVRNIGYKTTKEKVSSEPALYDCVGLDMIRDNQRIDALVGHLAASYGLPASPAGSPEWSPSWGVPRVVVCNCQIPYKTGRMFASHPEDDGGQSSIAYFVLSRRSAELLSRGTTTPALRMLRRFTEAGESTKDGVAFKVIGRVEDLDSYDVPQSFHQFNNKPVLLTKSATVHTGRLPEVLEIDYDVRTWVYLARTTLTNYHQRARETKIDIAYVVEGKTDEELPEQVLGCFKIINMDITAARWVSLM